MTPMPLSDVRKARSDTGGDEGEAENVGLCASLTSFSDGGGSSGGSSLLPLLLL